MDASESAQELQVQTQEVTMEGETPSRQVRATVVQAATVMYNTPATLDKGDYCHAGQRRSERLLAEAAQLGSQLVVFPEAFIGGYPRGASFAERLLAEAAQLGSQLVVFPEAFIGGYPRGASSRMPKAAQLGSQLVVFPEAFIGGYPRGASFGVLVGSRTDRGRDEFRRYHASAIDVPGPEVARLTAAAAKYGVFVVMGAIERAGGTLYCSVLFIDPRLGLVGRHRKTVPTALERVIWGCGDGSTAATVVDAGGVGREWSSTVRQQQTLGTPGKPPCTTYLLPPSPSFHLFHFILSGVELYCAPTADSRDSWQATVQHIALEGGCFVLSANQFCVRSDYPPPPDFVFSASGRLDADGCAGAAV
ncbi:unnamed protein product [Closterium sp. Naga37s-1]|nr:unnamed protein product [Closterium sp. Naga37s-1]